MRVPVEVPFLSEALPTMRILRWHQAAGAHVTKGAPLIELTTDKIDFTVEAPASGTLTDVTAAEGADVRPQEVVAMIDGS